MGTRLSKKQQDELAFRMHAYGRLTDEQIKNMTHEEFDRYVESLKLVLQVKVDEYTELQVIRKTIDQEMYDLLREMDEIGRAIGDPPIILQGEEPYVQGYKRE